MNPTFGFIGTGNMGSALVRAAAQAMDAKHITLADQCAEKAAALAKEIGCTSTDVKTLAQNCYYIFLGVKPQVMESMLSDIAPVLASRQDRFVLVSMAAGLSIADIRRMAKSDYPVIRIMPNIPASVGGGVILFDCSENVKAEEISAFRENMRFAGLVDPLPEKLIDAGSALSGCGPAFVCLFVEALADGAVACGLPRDKALAYAAQTLAGTATMLLKTGIHPGQLKDAVCSPGGTTIAGVMAMEESGFRAGAMDAVMAAYQRTLELGK
ncbi:MAG: pyrroline-5-carboxylate reductase [Oscillospiraceae bacterium]|nr:pyrroline-5-carboxylate reductase [Oscillospiraceae bacterium]